MLEGDFPKSWNKSHSNSSPKITMLGCGSRRKGCHGLPECWQLCCLLWLVSLQRGAGKLDSSDAFGGWPRLRGGRPQSSDFEDFEWKNQAEFERHLRDLFVGRDELKKTLLEIFTWAEDLKERREQHSSIPMTPMHTVFVGNPGTGKTTVAKIVGKMFKQFGLVQKGHVVEARCGVTWLGKIPRKQRSCRGETDATSQGWYLICG